MLENGIEVDGYVYLIHSTNSLHKIGCSGQPRARLAKLQRHHKPHELTLLHLIPSSNMRTAESDLHDHFAEKRIAGEWFDLTDDDVDFIFCITRMMKYPAPERRTVFPAFVTACLLDARNCEQNNDALIQLSGSITGFRLLCDECKQPAELTVFRDYDKCDSKSAPYGVDLHCQHCSRLESLELPAVDEPATEESEIEVVENTIHCSVCGRTANDNPKLYGRPCGAVLGGLACSGYLEAA